MVRIIVSCLLGIVAGWAAGKIMHFERNIIVNLVLGLVGGALGGWIGGKLGVTGGWIVGLILAIVGACILIFLYRLIFGKK